MDSERPSILFLNRVYPPAEGATGQLLAELAPELVRAGHDVTVLTSAPPPENTFGPLTPTLSPSKGARETPGLPASEIVEGVRVERVRGLPFTRASHWRRALSYLALYPALLKRALQLPRADVVVTLTDPPLHLLLGPVLRCFKGSRLIHWAQDIYPELAEELGVLRPRGVVAGICRRLSTFGLRRHDRIIAVGRCMKERLVRRGIDAAKIEVIPNWACGGGASRERGAGSRPPSSALPAPCSLLVMYSGNLGLAHQFDGIIQAADILARAQPEIRFVFVGKGPRLAAVQAAVAERQLSNVTFRPPQPLEKLGESLAAADVHLASMREELCGLVVPSKVYGVLAAGRACVFLGPRESEVARLIEQHQCGAVIPPHDGAALAECLATWAKNPALVFKAGARASDAVVSGGLAEAVQGFHRLVTPAR